MKVLLALGRSAPSVGSGLIREFFEAFSQVAGDPVTDLALWIRAGAPLGVLRPAASRGVFPAVAEGAPATQRD
eukprot:7148185-Alexandrium_andersonii.AAC.1